MGIESRLNPYGRDSQVVGPPIVRDQTGKALEIGDQVLVLKTGVLARVAQITPLLHPGAPPNMMMVRLVTVIDVAVPRNAALDDVFRVTTALEMGGVQPPGNSGPPAADPSTNLPPDGKVVL